MTTTATLDLVPARALNQVTYCERLYFLQYVDGVCPVNEHVEGGLFDHRRVADPNLANRPRKEGDDVRTRGVTLSSERLGVTAVLDLIEENAGAVYPVETKHGSAPRDETGQPTFHLNDAVQLCAQGMLLEEDLDWCVKHGELFYAGSRERVRVPFTQELREATRAAIARIRELNERSTPPEPLAAELRHRCFGCSLAPICQPEETLFAIRQTDAPTPDGVLTRVIPQSDDGAVLYVQEPGARLGIRSEHLVITKDRQEMGRAPLHAIRQVVVFGNVQVSTQALHLLAANGVAVAYLSGYGRFVAAVLGPPAKNVALREAQFQRFNDPAECLRLAKAVIRAKLANQRTLLMRSLRNAAADDDGQPEATPSAASPSQRGSDEPAAHGIADLLTRIDAVANVETLLGIEGQGAALYFSAFGRFLKAQPPGAGFDFRSRNRRPPRDPVNALLSFAYALLVKDCFAALLTVGFDPYRGFYHTGRHGRPSLALDLMEEFRAVIADSVVLTLINNRLVTPGDFLVWRDACHLTEDGRKKFFTTYEQRKSTVVSHPVYGYKMSYSRMLEVQARMLASYLRGETPRYVGFTVR